MRIWTPAVPIKKARIRKAADPALTQILNALGPAYAEVFLGAVAAVADDLTLTDVRDAIDNGSIGQLVDAIDWAGVGAPYLEKRLPPVLRKALEQSAGVASKAIDKLPGPDFVFDLTSQASLDWIQEAAGDLIKDITDSQKDSLKDILETSWDNGTSAADVSRMLRDGQVFGLTGRDAQAVINYRERLVAEGDYTASEISGATEKYSSTLLDARADSISRTEVADAYQEGKREAWGQALDEGYVKADEAEKEWLCADPCEQCEPYDGTVIGIEDDFDEGDPPLHPRCECDVIMHPFGK